ncbi:MAG: hypothetical protein HYX68_15195 [Planctomycetes bacterium]|nr:hypothetical protein [Planctomycetota bacterium]
MDNTSFGGIDTRQLSWFTQGVTRGNSDMPDHRVAVLKTWATLGAKFIAIRWWAAYCCLTWHSEDPKLSCCISENFPTRKLATGIHERFRRINAKALWVDDREVGISLELKPEAGACFEEILEGLSVQWIKIWKKAGGMKQVLKECSV